LKILNWNFAVDELIQVVLSLHFTSKTNILYGLDDTL
jgi:hypothetical protein